METIEEQSAEEVKAKQEKSRVYELLVLCNSRKTTLPEYRDELHALIKNSETVRKLIEKQHGMYETALSERINKMPSSETIKEVMLVKCDQLREELGYSFANQLERLAIEQVVICWVNYYETQINHATVLSQASFSRETGLYWEKKMQFSSARYTRALELLSKMRKMHLNIQVNAAINQIVSNQTK